MEGRMSTGSKVTRMATKVIMASQHVVSAHTTPLVRTTLSMLNYRSLVWIFRLLWSVIRKLTIVTSILDLAAMNNNVEITRRMMLLSLMYNLPFLPSVK